MGQTASGQIDTKVWSDIFETSFRIIQTCKGLAIIDHVDMKRSDECFIRAEGASKILEGRLKIGCKRNLLVRERQIAAEYCHILPEYVDAVGKRWRRSEPKVLEL